MKLVGPRYGLEAVKNDILPSSGFESAPQGNGLNTPTGLKKHANKGLVLLFIYFTKFIVIIRFETRY
jgi:hypothetical protein